MSLHNALNALVEIIFILQDASNHVPLDFIKIMLEIFVHLAILNAKIVRDLLIMSALAAMELGISRELNVNLTAIQISLKM